MVIDKKWLFGLLELPYEQSNGQVFAAIRSQIKNANRISQLDLGEGGKIPYGLGNGCWVKMMV